MRDFYLQVCLGETRPWGFWFTTIFERSFHLHFYCISVFFWCKNNKEYLYLNKDHDCDYVIFLLHKEFQQPNLNEWRMNSPAANPIHLAIRLKFRFVQGAKIVRVRVVVKHTHLRNQEISWILTENLSTHFFCGDWKRPSLHWQSL